MVTVSPKGDGVDLLYTSVAMLVLSWVTFVARVWVRVTRKALGMDDYIMALGLALFTVTASMCIVCCFYGSGQYAATLPASTKMRGIKLFFITEFFYAISAITIKCAIAVTLLRIADTRRPFVLTIWAIIVMSIISCIVFIAGVASICHPITTLWGETTTGSCNLKLNSDVSFFFSAIEIVTDFSMAFLPAVLLWNVQMKIRVKASVAMILGLAAFASCATIVRLRYLSLYSDPTEFMYSTGKIGLWSMVEEGIGIFAGSLPALRPLLSLSMFGGGSSVTPSQPPSTSAFKASRNKHNMLRSDVKLDTFHQLGDKEADNYGFGDGDSQKNILKETHVTVTSNERSNTPGQWHRSQVLGWKNKTVSEAASDENSGRV